MSAFYVDFSGFIKIEDPDVTTLEEAKEYFWEKYNNSDFSKEDCWMVVESVEEE